MGDSGSDGLSFRPALADFTPYEPGGPIEHVETERGLTRVIKLASNEGPFPPVPEAIEAIGRGASELNRYPDGGMVRLRDALAERHRVTRAQVVPAAGADAVVMYLSLAFLEPGTNIVCAWPTFPSYLLDARKVGAEARTVPLDSSSSHDLGALLAAIDEQTRIVYVCNPNNPTGTAVAPGSVDVFLDQVPPHVLTVLDEAYFEYVDPEGRYDGIDRAVRAGRQVVVLRTFSKIYGLAGLRVGYGVGPERVMSELRKVQNPFDVTQTAQDAALASLPAQAEVERRRQVAAAGRSELTQALRAEGFDVPEAVANFVYADLGRSAAELAGRLLAAGVMVRDLAPFGAEQAIRVTVGLPEEQEAFLAALRSCL